MYMCYVGYIGRLALQTCNVPVESKITTGIIL